ncbi:uncharacterized protein LOC112056732 [Bicyclus anynana]|uniref:Uncharacterized protein LOC112056732 n=1 Tax=Bicyclus anynana TaxID=110368 RepID=A0ABM3LID6_BICAN|nr:uncharacterized protein LOC112056732 [Bicyclus anynana]
MAGGLMAQDLLKKILQIALSKEEERAVRNTLGQVGLRGEYIEMYNEMLKASQDSAGSIETMMKLDLRLTLEDLRVRSIAGHRRSNRMSSSTNNRRVRSQALRRRKLNSQGLKSHNEHSRHSIINRLMK